MDFYLVKKRPDVALSSVFWQLVTVRPFPPPARHFHPVKFNRNRWLVRDEQWKDHWGKYETYHISITVTERESLCCSSLRLVFNSSVWGFNSKLLCWVWAFLVRLKEEGASLLFFSRRLIEISLSSLNRQSRRGSRRPARSGWLMSCHRRQNNNPISTSFTFFSSHHLPSFPPNLLLYFSPLYTVISLFILNERAWGRLGGGGVKNSARSADVAYS